MRSVAAVHLELDAFQDCVYQMVHRAASACGPCEGRTPALVYLHFSSDSLPACASVNTQTPPYLKDLQALHRFLGSPNGFSFFLIELPIQYTASFREIETLRKRAAETGQRVRSTIRDSKLFRFDKPKVHELRA